MLNGKLSTAWLPDCRNSSSWRRCDIMERIFLSFSFKISDTISSSLYSKADGIHQRRFFSYKDFHRQVL